VIVVDARIECERDDAAGETVLRAPVVVDDLELADCVDRRVIGRYRRSDSCSSRAHHRLNPGDSGALYLLAKAYRSEGQTARAEVTMHRVIDLHIAALDAEKCALKDAGIVKER